MIVSINNFFRQIKKKECMRGSMPVKFFYIFDKVENTSIASHRGLRTHLIKKISLGVYIYIYIYIYTPPKLNYTEL